MFDSLFSKLLDFDSTSPKPNKFTLYMGEQIKKAREEAGISQEKLARAIYRRRATLSDIENGKVEVESGTLALLAYQLKKPLTYFYPNYLVVQFEKEKLSALEHEMLLHFEQVFGDETKKAAIDIVKRLSKMDIQNLYSDVKVYAEYMQEEERIQEELEEERKSRKSRK